MIAKLLEKLKGKLLLTGIAAILGIGAVGAATGLDIVDGPEGAVCIAPAEKVTEDVAIVTE